MSNSEEKGNRKHDPLLNYKLVGSRIYSKDNGKYPQR